MYKGRLMQIQFALFFSEIENRPDRFINRIDEALEGVFDQMPTIIPVPEGAPAEVPNVIMQSSDGLYVCNIAKSRIDFIANYIIYESSSDDDFDNFMEKARQFATVVFGYKKIGRFGFVATYFFEDNDGISKIKSKYLKKNLGELEELSIRYNKRFRNHNLVFNDLVDIGSGSLNTTADIQQAGLLVRKDVNNVVVDSIPIETMLNVLKERRDKFSLSGVSELII